MTSPLNFPRLPYLLLGSAALALGPVGAQNLHVVPNDLELIEGTAAVAMPGISVGDRLQVVIAADQLGAVAGSPIRGLMLRRDSGYQGSLASATGQVVVRIGHAAHSPDHALPSFAGNLPAPVEVFRGAVIAPASAAGPVGPSFAANAAVRIDFAQPFTYQGGPLCVELESIHSAGEWWPVDATQDAVRGSALSVGSACGAAGMLGETAGVLRSGLVVGRTATFNLIGTANSNAFLLVGLGIRAHPLDLTPFGAPGCSLQVDPIVALPTFLSPAEDGIGGFGIANFDLHLPTDTRLMSCSLGTQWLELTPPSFATSNAMSCQLAPVPPALPVVSIVARSNETPRVQSVAVPVLGLLWQ